MKDPLLKIAFLCFILSFSALTVFFYFEEIPEYQIKLFNEDLPAFFYTEGKITSIKQYENVSYAIIQHQCTMEAVIFEKNNTNLKVFENKEVFLEGHTLEDETIVVDMIKIKK